jgi:hypothetical protein
LPSLVTSIVNDALVPPRIVCDTGVFDTLMCGARTKLLSLASLQGVETELFLASPL